MRQLEDEIKSLPELIAERSRIAALFAEDDFGKIPVPALVRARIDEDPSLRVTVTGTGLEAAMKAAAETMHGGYTGQAFGLGDSPNPIDFFVPGKPIYFFASGGFASVARTTVLTNGRAVVEGIAQRGITVGTATLLKAGATRALQRVSVVLTGLPKGITATNFKAMAELIFSKAGNISDDIAVHGSRVSGAAAATADIDIAIRVSPAQFDQLIKRFFKTPNPGSSNERTMKYAIDNGIIQAGEAKLSGLRKELEALLGKEVDISVIKKGGKFDSGPWIPLPKPAGG